MFFFIKAAVELGIFLCKGTLLGTPNREPQEYSRNMMEYKDPGRYIPILYTYHILGVPSWGFAVESL